MRAAYGLPPALAFADVSPDPLLRDAFEEAYGEIGYLELWVGGLAEEPLPGAMIGETFHTILVDQFRRLREGDRYWFEHDPFFLANAALLAEVRATTLADIIRRNTTVGDELAERVFGGPLPPIVSIAAAPDPVVAGTPATFTLTRSGPVAWALTVDVEVAGVAVMPDSPTSTLAVTFAPGNVTASFSVPTDVDAPEAPRTVSARIAEARSYRVEAGRDTAAVLPAPGASACLLGEVTARLSLVIYGGGSVEELVSCARSMEVTALYALVDGVWVPYIVGAPEFVNRPFGEIFEWTLAPLTPLLAQTGEPPDEDADGN